MLLKAVGQPLGTAKRYRKAFGKCPKAIGKLSQHLREIVEGEEIITAQ